MPSTDLTEYVAFDTPGFTKWINPFVKDRRTLVFQNHDHQLMVIFPWSVDGPTGRLWMRNEIFISNDGLTFYQQHELGFGGTPDVKYHLSYEDPRLDNKYHLLFEKKQVLRLQSDDNDRISGMTEFNHYQLIDFRFSSDALFVPLPEISQPEYLVQLLDGRYVFVDGVKYGYTYERLKCFVGTVENMVEVPITDVERFRDGGSTLVCTTVGNLWMPFNAQEKSTWREGDDDSSSAESVKVLSVTSPSMLELLNKMGVLRSVKKVVSETPTPN